MMIYIPVIRLKEMGTTFDDYEYPLNVTLVIDHLNVYADGRIVENFTDSVIEVEIDTNNSVDFDVHADGLYSHTWCDRSLIKDKLWKIPTIIHLKKDAQYVSQTPYIRDVLAPIQVDLGFDFSDEKTENKKMNTKAEEKSAETVPLFPGQCYFCATVKDVFQSSGGQKICTSCFRAVTL